jgi:hypothetical protein
MPFAWQRISPVSNSTRVTGLSASTVSARVARSSSAMMSGSRNMCAVMMGLRATNLKMVRVMRRATRRDDGRAEEPSMIVVRWAN